MCIKGTEIAIAEPELALAKTFEPLSGAIWIPSLINVSRINMPLHQFEAEVLLMFCLPWL